MNSEASRAAWIDIAETSAPRDQALLSTPKKSLNLSLVGKGWIISAYFLPTQLLGSYYIHFQ